MKIGITYFEDNYYALVKYLNGYGQEKVTLRKVQADKNGAFIRHEGANISVDRELAELTGGELNE